MGRKLLMLAWVVGLVCLLGIVPALAQGVYSTLSEYEKLTGKKIEKFNEPPMLKVKVAAGELPPVEQRLPEEPQIIEPIEEIGQYGGTLLTIQRSVNDWGNPSHINYENILGKDPTNPTKVLPNIAKDWELSPDAKSLTLYLRKGMKWSDGQPFTADDIVFWYSDVLQNKELTPVIPNVWKPGGRLMQVEKIDDYTVKLKFAVSWPGVLFVLSTEMASENNFYLPFHYLKKFHIKYNPDADKLAKKKGYDHWYQLFAQKGTYDFTGKQSSEEPTLSAWIPEVIAPDHITLVRNPYYWKVDTEGNQLPYIDKMKGILAEKTEMRVAKILSGEPDLVGEHDVDISKFPVIMQTADKNNYRVSLEEDVSKEPPAVWQVGLYFNHTVPDPFLRELFGDVRFKQALSLAINRSEVCQLVFLNRAAPNENTLTSASPFYERRTPPPYDPQRAKQLLDEIGLKTNKEGYRLRPDGKVLNLVIETAPWIGTHAPTAELVKDYWEKIGIKTSIDATSGGEMWTLFDANKSQISMWYWGQVKYCEVMAYPQWWVRCQFWGQRWQLWFQTGGKKGEEPPADVKEFVNAWCKIPYTVNEEERIDMGKRAIRLLWKNLWFFGIATEPPTVRAARKSLRNIDIDKIGTVYETWAPYQWFFKK